MGWFEEQVKQRKKLDAKTFEDSFKSLAGIHVKNQKNLSDEEIRENFAISQILSYFHHQMVDIPAGVTKFKDKLNYILGHFGIEYHNVQLTDAYVNENGSPLLIYTLIGEIPIILFPAKGNQYYYIHYGTGKKTYIDAAMIHGLEIDAISFYRPLPSKGVSIKEYVKYIGKSIRPLDIVLLIVFAALSSGVGLLVPYLTQRLTGEVVLNKDISLFIAVSLYVVAAATGVLLVKAVQAFVNTRIMLKIQKSVQEATMMRVLNLPAAFFKKYNTGELTARFSSVNSLASMIVNGIFTTLVSVVMSLAYLFQLAGFASTLVPIVVAILFATTAFSVAIALIQKKYTRQTLELSSKESGVTYEMINGIQKIRLSGSEKRVFAKWASAYARSAEVRYHPPLILRLSPAISLLITLLGNVAIYYVAARSGLSAGSYMAFVTGYGVLSGAFASVTSMVGVITSIKPTYDMAKPILEAEPETAQNKLVLEKVKGNIRFENVSFKYIENGPLILNDLSLDIKEGEYVAIVGQTGCGKSTLIRVLLGFEEPLSGRVTVDGHDVKDLDPSSLRRRIGTVLQNGTLFHADIFSNIIISCPNASEEDAWAAAEIADIADDIREMPMGMKTVISEGQGGISGGQKQRIMIARAIVHHPKILIFDEATSALDNKTQKSITESINKLNCTRLVIAHRLSTIKNADRIIMLEGGKIIEEGSYDSLIAQKGKFAELVERQRLDNNE
ncbi:MAG: ATP-binding cassette domain-containing protein [Bacilli bacterium]|nr:ATP-binding cassette domain-containing protein [Bacilli bacterium]MBO6284999.1 ATP-binding cassette domain-containing protein [Bacilli bacterium]